jgi:hypothetical protein
VFGHTDLIVNCPAQTGFNCHFSVALYVDGQPVPGSDQSPLIVNNTSPPELLDLFGIVPNVPAGAHHVTIGWNGDSPNPTSIVEFTGENHTAALALGG